VLNAWGERKAQVQQRATSVEQRTKSLQQKLDRLEEAFIFDRTIDRDTYERQKARLREDIAESRPRSWKKSTQRGFWRSRSAFYRAPRSCGCTRRSISVNAYSSCSLPTGSFSTESDLIEPP
jgi:hypothetical protein